MGRKLQKICRRIVNDRRFLLAVFIIILLSTVFLIIELAFFPPYCYTWVHWINDLIGVLFAAELLIRWIAIGRFRDFIKEYWIDVLAVIPMLPLRALRAFRLVRLLRFITLFVFMRRHLRLFIRVIRKRSILTLAVTAILIFLVLFSCLIYSQYEAKKQGKIDNFTDTFWIIVFSFFSDQYSKDLPVSGEGKIILVLVMIAGMSFFAILTGTIAAQYSAITNAIREGAILGKQSFKDMEEHIIICGWNESVPRILGELQQSEAYRDRNYLIISEIEHLPDLSHYNVDMTLIYHINRDFANASNLVFANIAMASVVIIVSDLSRGRTENDADARTVLTAMTVERINPGIYTCVELLHEENVAHLTLSKVESIVLSSNIAAYLLAQSALKAHFLSVYTELLHPSEGNSFFDVAFPVAHIGSSFSDVIADWKNRYNSILIGIRKDNGEIVINPEKHVIHEYDRAVVIAKKEPVIAD